jgi:hypothetical protein
LEVELFLSDDQRRGSDEIDECLADGRLTQLPLRRSKVDADRLLQILDELEGAANE